MKIEDVVVAMLRDKVRMVCRMPGCTNFCVVDTVPASHHSWTCPECEAHEFEQDIARMAQADEASRAMLGGAQ